LVPGRQDIMRSQIANGTLRSYKCIRRILETLKYLYVSYEDVIARK